MKCIDAEVLEEFVQTLFEQCGLPADRSLKVAKSLVASDLRGVGSHGVILAPVYIERVEEENWVDVNAEPHVQEDGSSFATVTGRSFGQLTGRTAVNVGLSKAETNGIAAVGIRNGAHLGRIGEWAEKTTEEGLLFAAFVAIEGTSREWVAPPGSADRRLSTNPISIGVPTFGAKEFPIVLDMATTQVAAGKTREWKDKGEPLPDSWTVTSTGEPVSDPAQFRDGKGALLPFGGHSTGYKGFGLSVVAELLAGIFSSGTVSGQSGPRLTQNTAAFLFIDPTRFATVSSIERKVEALAAHIKSAEYSKEIEPGPTAKHGTGLLPGEGEYLNKLDREENGIPLPDETITSLFDVANEYGIPESVPDAF